MRANNYLKLMITMLVISAPVMAAQGKNESSPLPADDDSPQVSSTVDDGDGVVARKLTQLKSDVLILNAEAKKAEAQKRLKEVTGGKYQSTGVRALPRVKTIFGRGENLHAELELGDGNVVEVSAGDKNISGMDIIAITKSSVTIRTEGASISVPLQHINQDISGNQRNDKNNYIPQPRFQ